MTMTVMNIDRLEGPETRSFRARHKAYRDLRIWEAFILEMPPEMMRRAFGLSASYLRRIRSDVERRLGDEGKERMAIEARERRDRIRKGRGWMCTADGLVFADE